MKLYDREENTTGKVWKYNTWTDDKVKTLRKVLIYSKWDSFPKTDLPRREESQWNMIVNNLQCNETQTSKRGAQRTEH